ncbi:MAG TPA: acetyl/propionyl-CoA carboxylase subunit alpha, partial [Nocardioides sp.]|uniref:biotin/lipoyl-containing protein n=1 Tax=Nocardioides sp. TaxID=35761 RepID=UPI002C2E5F56
APEAERMAAVAATVALADEAAAARRVQRGVPVAWRNVPSQPQVTGFRIGSAETEVHWWGGRDGYTVEGATVLDASPTGVRLEIDGVTERAEVMLGVPSADGSREIHVDGPDWSVRLRTVPRFTDPSAAVASGSLLAPMPGTVVRVAVEVGREVAAGDTVLVLEAMKMQHAVNAPHAGVLTRLDVTAGAQVAAGEVLAVVSAGDDPAPAHDEGEQP